MTIREKGRKQLDTLQNIGYKVIIYTLVANTANRVGAYSASLLRFVPG